MQADPMNMRMMCPSAPAEEGALLLGMIRQDGFVAYLKDKIEVTQEFVALTRTGRSPEQRFRFSSPCQESACAQWAGASAVYPRSCPGLVPPSDVSKPLPRCTIEQGVGGFTKRAPMRVASVRR